MALSWPVCCKKEDSNSKDAERADGTAASPRVNSAISPGTHVAGKTTSIDTVKEMLAWAGNGGEHVDRPEVELADGKRYCGQWLGAERDGKGALTWPDSRKYEGQFRMNSMEGQGVLVHVDGTRYRGAFDSDKAHGEGVFEWPDGCLYDGSWERAQQHGTGTTTWPDGSTYVGDFDRGEMHGHGVLKYGDGEMYEGSFVKSEIIGDGKYTDKNGISITDTYERIGGHRSRNPQNTSPSAYCVPLPVKAWEVAFVHKAEIRAREQGEVEMSFDEGQVHLKHQPVGLTFDPATNCVYKVAQGSHAASLGIKVGWRVKTLRGRRVAEDWSVFFKDYLKEIAALKPVKAVRKSQLELGFREGLVYVTKRPVGIIFDTGAEPGRVCSVSEHAEELGVQPGWTLETFEGKPVSSDFQSFFCGFLEHLNRLPGQKKARAGRYCLPLLFQRLNGTMYTIPVLHSPLGLQFVPKYPIIVGGVEGLAAELGIRPGWKLIQFADQRVDMFKDFTSFFLAFQDIISKLSRAQPG